MNDPKRPTASAMPVTGCEVLPMLSRSLWRRLSFWHCRGLDWREVPCPNWHSRRRINPDSVYW